MSRIHLTEKEEQQYVDAISFDLGDNFQTRLSKLNAMGELTEALLERGAIPEQRIDFFTKEEFQTGRRRKSRKEVFESNGTSGPDIFRHPHFLKYLNFFVEGHNMDDSKLYSKLREIADDNIYLDDAADEIIDYLKSNSLIPKIKADRHKLADHVFMIGADLKLDSSDCHSLRNKIRG